MSKKTKSIDSLVDDIYGVVSDRGGWDETINEYFKERVGTTLMGRLGPTEEEYNSRNLRMSSIGQPCERKLWYQTNRDSTNPEASDLIKFLYGDILEDLLLSLAVAAGHDVQGEQDELEIHGIKGHRDAVIDGVTIDVKSASPYSFKKFQEGRLEEDDPFGYMSQLSSYVFAAKDDPLVKDKKGGAFLVIDKVNGTLCLDYHDFKESGHLDEVEELYTFRKALVDNENPPPRGYPTEAEGKSGNRKLGFACSFCPFKNECYKGLRSFKYANGRTIHLTKIVREPRLTEIK